MIRHLTSFASLAMIAAAVFTFVLRARAERYRVAPHDQVAPGVRGGMEPEGRTLLLRAARWYRAAEGVFIIWAALVLLLMVLEARRGSVSWGLPGAFGLYLAGAVFFDGGDIASPTYRVYRGFPDLLGFHLRRTRNRIAFTLWGLGLLVFVLWPR